MVDSDADVVLIGGVAIILHGGSHLTEDVDFAFVRTRENTKRIADALRTLHPRPWNWPSDLPFVWDDQSLMNSTVLTLDTDWGRIDFLAEPAGIKDYKSLKANACTVKVHGREITLASIDDLIAMKRAAGRAKDLGHVAELETLRGLIADESQS